MKKKNYSLAKFTILVFVLLSMFTNAQINRTENFDSSNAIPSGFAAGGNIKAILKTDGLHAISGTNYMQLYSSDTSDPSTLSYTNSSDFSAGKPVFLGFSYSYANSALSVDATALVEYSTDSGVTWMSAGILTIPANTASSTSKNFSAPLTTPVVSGTPISIKITFKLKDTAGAYLYIDDVIVNQTGILAVQNPLKSKSIIFPTITTGIVSIKTDNAMKVIVYNTCGSIVKSIDIKKGNSVIDLTGFIAGMYYITVGTESFKIIKEQ